MSRVTRVEGNARPPVALVPVALVPVALVPVARPPDARPPDALVPDAATSGVGPASAGPPGRPRAALQRFATFYGLMVWPGSDRSTVPHKIIAAQPAGFGRQPVIKRKNP